MIGIEISSARCSPLLTSWVIALSSEPLPASLKVTPWSCAASWLTKCCTSAARVSGLLGSPRSVTTTSAVRPPARDSSGERSGPSTDFTAGRRRAPGLERRHRVRGALRAARADEHVLGRGALEARGGKPGVGTGRFTGAGTRVRERAHAGARAERHARDDQREPERDGRLRATRRASGRGVDETGEHAGACRAAPARRATGACRPARPQPEPADPPNEVVDEGVISMGSQTAVGGPQNRWGDRASGGLRTPVLDGGENPTSHRSTRCGWPA